MTKLEKARDRVVKAAMKFSRTWDKYKLLSSERVIGALYDLDKACAALAKLEGKKCSSKN